MAGWDPEKYLDAVHGDVRLVETLGLPAPLQACVDHEKRIIWLTIGLSQVQRRCALAYEIGQLEQGPTPEDPCLARARQKAAEDWAARRLLSLPAVLDGFAVASTIPEIAAVLRVDAPTLRARLRGLTDEEQDAVVDVLRRDQPVA